jgi:hypothetical protein
MNNELGVGKTLQPEQRNDDEQKTGARSEPERIGTFDDWRAARKARSTR